MERNDDDIRSLMAEYLESKVRSHVLGHSTKSLDCHVGMTFINICFEIQTYLYNWCTKKWILCWPEQNDIQNTRRQQKASPRSRILSKVALLSTAQQEVLASQLENVGRESFLQMQKPHVVLVKKRGRPTAKGKANKKEKSHLEHVESSFVNYKCIKCGKRWATIRDLA